MEQEKTKIDYFKMMKDLISTIKDIDSEYNFEYQNIQYKFYFGTTRLELIFINKVFNKHNINPVLFTFNNNVSGYLRLCKFVEFLNIII